MLPLGFILIMTEWYREVRTLHIKYKVEW